VRHPDLVNRDFTAPGPDRLWLADFTYLRCHEGVVFFAFVIDAFSRRIVGWQFAANMRTDLVLDALRMALTTRDHGADVTLIHHSDAGSQGGFKWWSQRLSLEGCDGQAGGLDDRVDGQGAFEVARGAVAAAGCRAAVLAGDREGVEQ
jgi:transposase InsO family protein